MYSALSLSILSATPVDDRAVAVAGGGHVAAPGDAVPVSNTI